MSILSVVMSAVGIFLLTTGGAEDGLENLRLLATSTAALGFGVFTKSGI